MLYVVQLSARTFACSYTVFGEDIERTPNVKLALQGDMPAEEAGKLFISLLLAAKVDHRFVSKVKY